MNHRALLTRHGQKEQEGVVMQADLNIQATSLRARINTLRGHL